MATSFPVSLIWKMDGVKYVLTVTLTIKLSENVQVDGVFIQSITIRFLNTVSFKIFTSQCVAVHTPVVWLSDFSPPRVKYCVVLSRSRQGLFNCRSVARLATLSMQCIWQRNTINMICKYYTLVQKCVFFLISPQYHCLVHCNYWALNKDVFNPAFF